MTDWGKSRDPLYQSSPWQLLSSTECLASPVWGYARASVIPLTSTIGHNSAFAALYPPGLKNPSILLNGRGNVTRFSGVPATLPIPEPLTITFQKQTNPRPKRYLLRLINTSFGSTFVFSIDNHNLTVASADFVPIHPYSNTSVLIGIGQRYNVIVEANPIANGSQPIPPDGNFWMRTYVARCFGNRPVTRPDGYERSGILRYDDRSTALPSSKPWNAVSLACSDETYSSLRPVLPWKVGSAANNKPNGNMEEHDVFGNALNFPTPFPVAFFSLEDPTSSSFTPLRIDYRDPTFLHLNFAGPWPNQWVITPENYKSTDWVCQGAPRPRGVPAANSAL